MLTAMALALTLTTDWMEWFAVSFDGTQATYVFESSLDGPPTERSGLAMTVFGKRQGATKALEYSVTVDCEAWTIQTHWMVSYAAENVVSDRNMDGLPLQTIRPDTNGQAIAAFFCDDDIADMSDGTPIMLDPYIVTDQGVRMVNIGIDPNVALALASMDEEQAPNAFADILNAAIPIERQMFVRAIKDRTGFAE